MKNVIANKPVNVTASIAIHRTSASNARTPPPPRCALAAFRRFLSETVLTLKPFASYAFASNALAFATS